MPLSNRAELPLPAPAAEAASGALRRHITAAIAESGGWLSFARFMELALYAPGLGYYSGGSAKLGESGDFVTAPELSPLFAQCVARQVAQIIQCGLPDILEAGAGSGTLAVTLLKALEAADALPRRYLVLEVSAELRERQRERMTREIPHLAARVQWLDALPDTFEGVVIGNELLDAMPVHLVRTRAEEIDELGVVATQSGFERGARPATGELLNIARALALPDDYETEVNLASRAFVRSVGERLTRGVILFFDYGFPAAELYHPQRSRGTLMCHYRHRAHDDPFALVGLQDITSHVDFTSIADAGLDVGLKVFGYTSQAQFLVNCGITDFLGRTSAEDVRTYAPLAGEAQKLLSPAEMGELFKAIALGRGIDVPLVGFLSGDRTHSL